MRKRVIHILGILLVVIALVLPLIIQTPVLAAPTTYYVSTLGNDGNDGLDPTPAHAWLTIQHAADTMVAGDTVEIKAGTYTEEIEVTTSGAVGSYITYKNYASGTVIIDGTGGSQNGTFMITNADYIWLEGIEIQNAFRSGVQAHNTCHFLMFKDLYIHDTYSSAIIINNNDPNPVIGNMHDITIDDVTTDDTNTSSDQEGISLVGVNNFEIKNCNVGSTYSALTGGYDAGIDLKVGCIDGSVHDNEIHDTGTGIYIDCHGYDSSNIDIYNNYIHNNMGGISIAEEHYSKDATDIVMYNNLICDNYYQGFNVGENIAPYFDKTFTFINNTLYHNGGTGYREIFLADPSGYTSCIIRNNIIVAHDSGTHMIYDRSSSGVTFDHNLYYSLGGYNVDTYGTDYIKADPLFVSTSDFSLQSSSPAIDMGSSTSAPATDYNGTARPQGSGYDMGAFESGATITTPSITLDSVTSLTQTTVRLNSTITSGGGDPNCSVRFGYGTISHGASDFDSFATITSWVAGYEINDEPYVDVASLTADTAYYVAVQVKNYYTTSTSTTGSFATLVSAVTAPSIIAQTATNISTTTARLNAYIITDGSDTSVQVRFGYGTTSLLPANFATYDTITEWVDGYHINNFPFVSVASLVATTPYYFNVQVKNSHSTVTGATEISFTTLTTVASAATFNGLPSATSISLSWVKPSGSNNVLIRCRNDTYPTTTADGAQVYYGSDISYIQASLVSGMTYYYSLWGESGGVYSTTPLNLVLTTSGSSSTIGELPEITLPGNMNQKSSSASWYDNLQPFTGIISAFADDWGMPRDNSMLTLSAFVMVSFGAGAYIKTRNFFISYAIVIALDLLAIGMHVMFGWSLYVLLALGLGVWAIEHNFQ
jgi:hypothetical protein